MKMGLAPASHPLANHQRFSEMHQIEELFLEVEAAEVQEQGKPLAVAARVGEQGLQMSFGCTEQAVGLDVIGSPEFLSFFFRQGFGWAIRWIDGRGVDAKA